MDSEISGYVQMDTIVRRGVYLACESQMSEIMSNAKAQYITKYSHIIKPCLI